MVKHIGSGRPVASSAGSPGIPRGLIDAIHDLLIRIASRLRHAQIERSAMGDAQGDYDIWQKIGNHVQRVSAEHRPDQQSRTGRKRTAKPVDRAVTATVTTGQPSRFTEHSRHKAAKRLLPRMHEQLQNKTMEHINIALIMAREGNAEGARLHIDLAQNAMHTASRFMSREEYEAFEQKVERRLESLVSDNRLDDAAISTAPRS